MADGNGSIADREDNKSLDAADNAGISGGTGNETAIGGSRPVWSAGGYISVANPTAGPSISTTTQVDINGKVTTSTGVQMGVGTPGAGVNFSVTGDLTENPSLTYGVGGNVGMVQGGLSLDPTKGVATSSLGLTGGGWISGGAYVSFDALAAAMNAIDDAIGQMHNSMGQQGWGNSGNPLGGMSPPIVLDLDGDGLDLVALDKSKAMYDIDGDGYLENVGWVGDGDGFLSVDLNGDGLILEPVELAFALSTEDPNDTDLEGLAATYDTNKDGVLDANDAEFAKFKVWRDIDQDGVCDAGEVKSLAEHGITSINLTSDKKEEMIAGNKVYGSTTYTKTDGTTGKVGDVGLATSAAGWKREEVTGGIKFNYEGTGDNAGRALFEAAAATALIMDVAAAGLAGAMGAELNDSLSASGDKDVLLGGGAGNDTLTGGAGNDWLAGGEGIDSLNGGAGHDILFVDSEDKIQGGDGFDVAIVTDDKAVSYDLAKIGIEAVSAGAGDDVLNANGVATSVVLDGGKGDDSLTGGKGDDILSGGEGEDIFKGGDGDDLIIMDADDKFENMDGGAGWDRVVYLGNQDLNLNITDYNVEFFQAGDGNDVIKTELDIQTDLDGGGGKTDVQQWKAAA